MAKNYYFENYENSMEQSLIEDLVVEAIRIYGIDVWYLPRTLVAKDDLLNEDDLSKFEAAYMVEMYVKSVDGFEGEGDFLSKFGLQIRDSVTMTMAQRTYENEIGLNTGVIRPGEGDLIYLPLNGKFFEIQHVEHESIFYQIGSLQTYDLRAELFEYSGEVFDTGNELFDHKFEDISPFASTVASTYSVEIRSGVYYIKDVSDYGDLLEQPIVEMYGSQTYVFDVSHPSLAGYPLRFYTTNSPNTGLDTNITGDATVVVSGGSGTVGATVTFTPITAGTLYYINETTLGMGNKLNIADSRLTVETYDALADNSTIEAIGDNIIDFSQTNPFGEDNY